MKRKWLLIAADRRGIHQSICKARNQTEALRSFGLKKSDLTDTYMGIHGQEYSLLSITGKLTSDREMLSIR